MKKLTRIGLSITATWALSWITLVINQWQTVEEMPLNALGDFLAGLSAPLALLWLVIGYFQQGEELRLNTETLRAQQDELRRQVEETALLAKNSDRQAAAAEVLAMINKEEQEREKIRLRTEAQPVFWPNGGTVSGGKITTNLLNRGGEVFDIEIHYDGPHQLRFSNTRLWEKDQKASFTLVQGPGTTLEWPISFSISYRDSLREFHTQQLEFVSSHGLQAKNS